MYMTTVYICICLKKIERNCITIIMICDNEWCFANTVLFRQKYLWIYKRNQSMKCVECVNIKCDLNVDGSFDGFLTDLCKSLIVVVEELSGMGLKLKFILSIFSKSQPILPYHSRCIIPINTKDYYSLPKFLKKPRSRQISLELHIIQF